MDARGDSERDGAKTPSRSASLKPVCRRDLHTEEKEGDVESEMREAIPYEVIPNNDRGRGGGVYSQSRTRSL